MATIAEVLGALEGRNTKSGRIYKGEASTEEFVNGRFQPLPPERVKHVSFDVDGRQRLDHYGNGGDGWDDEGWNRDYAEPLRAEVVKLLDQAGVKGAEVSIGEKGHIHVEV